MKNFCLLYFFAFSIFCNSCSKRQDTIDVSNIYMVDDVGNAITTIVQDGQWERKTFTNQELSLFNGLDTADLSGTQKPDSLLYSPILFPNPFSSEANLSIQFTNDYSGHVLLKYVIVNDHLGIVQQGARQIDEKPYFFNLKSEIPSGKYRIYFTISAQASLNFYESWGNIQKTN